MGLGNSLEEPGPKVFPSPGFHLGKEEAGSGKSRKEPGRTPSSEGPGRVVIDQVLRVLCGGDRGAGRGRGLEVVAVVVAAVTVSVEALPLVLEEAVTQQGYHHHDADDQEYCNGHLHGAWGKKGRNGGELPGPAQL